jgi:outer membrane biosynthesis protein TonB
MTAWSHRRRDSMAPALLAALVLHVGLLLALILVHGPSILPTGTAVPINIVANGPTTDSRQAEQAPVEHQAQVETPVPEARLPEPAPPPPQAAKSAPAPAPAPARSKPAIKPTPTKPAKDTFDLAAIQADVGARRSSSLNLAALQADVAREARAHPSRPASGARGPTQAETAHEVRVDAGTGVSQSDLAGLQQLLQRLWNPDCANGARPIIPVKFTIGYDGHLQGAVDTAGRDIRSDIDARRAVDAVHQAAPYADTYRGLTITVRFDAKTACAQHN